MYNEVLNLNLPEGFTIMGFSDEIIEIQFKGSDAIAKVKNWLNENGLKLAARETAEFRVGDFKVISEGSIK